MQLPESLLSSLQNVAGFDRTAFEAVHTSAEQVTSIRFNPAKAEGKEQDDDSLLPVAQKIPWTDIGFYLRQRPSFTFDPLFHAGCYYVQEASSMFLEQALQQSMDTSQALKVLDLCAAPGGKSTHLQSLLSRESLLVSNEVIKTRAGVLKQNIIKWGAANVVVTNNDPQHFQRLPGFFDVIVADAPCSGSGLFRRDEEAVNEWSPENVQLCCGRQQRILADVLPSLKGGGVLIYSTCSYSKQEDEDIADWLVSEMGLENIVLELQEDWNIVEATSEKSGAKGYRFYPYKVKGEGFFLSVFRKPGEPSNEKYKAAKPALLSAKEKEWLTPWMQTNELALLKQDNHIFALPQNLLPDFCILQAALYIQYAGVNVGELIRDKLVPDHALAMSQLLKPGIKKTEVDRETAIRYLQKADISIDAADKGWQLISYRQHPLGWINVLPNRVNNYYPKEMRILKQQNDRPFAK